MVAEENKKFIKLGRSWGMIIPPYFFKLLDINPNTDEMKLSVQDNKIVIEKK
ncbi:hypothetical protein IKJ53_07605 [bacterium]|nr:hypothetical protein [bacterium]